jgi:GTPase SAR1 family protein
MSKELIYKICLFGDRNVGKTSLTQVGIQKKEAKPPVCIDIAIKNLTLNLSNDKKRIPQLMVGGKLDLHKERAISRKYAKKISKKYKIVKYFECSSKTGENMEKIFKFLTRSILKVESYA